MNPGQDITRTDVRQRTPNASDNSRRLPEESVRHEPATLELIQALCQELEAESITYCHWKSNNAIELSASGDNDLDLLIRRADASRFAEVLYRLGFKQAKAPEFRESPGVLDYFGYDEKADRLVHVHAHYQLILGHDMTKNYRLPIEDPYLDSAVQGDLFRVPAPEFEFIVFVIRMILKHSTWDVILGLQGRLRNAERQELAWLEARIDHDRVHDILQQQLPYISVKLFKNCIWALRPGYPIWARARTGQRLQASLQANARRPLLTDICLKLWRRAALAIRRRIFKFSPKYRLQTGGAVIALVGGDGAGKSTAVDVLCAWLSNHFEVSSIHLGKPEWSWITTAVRGILKVGQLLGLYPVETSFRETLDQESLVSPGYPWLLREMFRARDRYLLYLRARRFAANGGFAILDRFPLPQKIQLMDGPRGERFVDELMAGPQAERFMSPHQGSKFARRLVRREESYYRQIVSPDMLIILRLDPEIAVQRKPEENAAFVRQRNTEIWERDWADTDAHVIDGSKPKNEVISEIKALTWSEL